VPVSPDPLWLESPPPRRPSLQGDVRCPVCVIGAGIGGASAALHLARLGVPPLVVEARGVATGASGRNGGFLIAGAAPFHNDARRLFGPDIARRIHARTLQSLEQVVVLAREHGAADAVRNTGILRLAIDEAEAEHVREHRQALAADGFAGDLVDEPDLPAAVRRPGRIGLLAAHDCAVQPARVVRAVAAAAEAAGARICEDTPVEVPRRAGRGWRLVAPEGVIHADTVVVAADGALPALVPELAGRVRARRLHMVATAPVEREILPMPIYARYGHEYAQQTPDGRIAAGGFSDLDGADSYTAREEPAPAVHERLREWLAEELGVHEAVTHAWAGVVGYSDDSRPLAGAVGDGLYVLGGYSGTGNLNGFAAGAIVAELIVRGGDPDADLYAPGRATSWTTSSKP
jgi:gamma-glutamylputrescine oxidase